MPGERIEKDRERRFEEKEREGATGGSQARVFGGLRVGFGGVEVSWRVRDGDGGQLEGRHLSLLSLGVSCGGGGGGATANIV